MHPETRSHFNLKLYFPPNKMNLKQHRSSNVGYATVIRTCVCQAVNCQDMFTFGYIKRARVLYYTDSELNPKTTQI